MIFSLLTPLCYFDECRFYVDFHDAAELLRAMMPLHFAPLYGHVFAAMRARCRTCSDGARERARLMLSCFMPLMLIFAIAFLLSLPLPLLFAPLRRYSPLILLPAC